MVVVMRTRTEVSVHMSSVCDRHWILLATGYPTGGRPGGYGTGGYGTGYITTNIGGRPIGAGRPMGYGGSGALGMGGYGPLGGGLPPKIRAIFIPQGGGGMMGGNQW